MTQAAIAVEGEVAPGFGRVRDVFEAHVADAGEGGVAYAAYHDGRKVVDLRTAPWTEQTTPVWMSTTKAFTATCVQLLSEAGSLDVDAPVCRYWPEFAAAGKETVSVADVMTHRSGVLGAPALTRLIDLTDGTGIDRTAEITEILAAAEPVWEPGTQTGYHVLTYGWVLGEVIRRVDGRGLSDFFHDEVAVPSSAPNTRIGTPAELHDRIPRVVPMMWPDAAPPAVREYMETVLAAARDPSTPAGVASIARDGVSVLDAIAGVVNNPPGRTTALGGSNLAGPAAEVARIFGSLSMPGSLVSQRSTDAFTAVRNSDIDVVLGIPIARALGYWRNVAVAGRPQVFGPNEEAFGHTGFGGQIGFADPKARVGVGYVRSHLTGFGYVPLLLNAALYESLG